MYVVNQLDSKGYLNRPFLHIVLAFLGRLIYSSYQKGGTQMMKKGTTIIASVLLVAAMAGPAAADGHMTKGEDTTGSRVQSYQNTNYLDRTNTNMNMDGNYRNNGDYRTNSVRANATTTNRDNGMSWGWLGLLGLLGLAGMRKRVTDHNER